ncbi:MAG TPA: DUF1629 domain-containing protein [Cellvibrio sp.]|nr:DUF1629 domain-containing protein [Cellvibrio sp.]
MKYYQMTYKIFLSGWDGREPSGLFQRSHDWVLLKTGEPLLDYENDRVNGEPFKGPLLCELDDEDETGVMATFYNSPAFIAKKSFYHDLRDIGIDNIEVHPVVIHDPLNNIEIDDYLLLNFLDSISCAVMEQSSYERLNEAGDPEDPVDSMIVMNELVIDPSKIDGQDLFLLREDTDCIVISERVYTHLQNRGYSHIVFEELKQI